MFKNGIVVAAIVATDPFGRAHDPAANELYVTLTKAPALKIGQMAHDGYAPCTPWVTAT